MHSKKKSGGSSSGADRDSLSLTLRAGVPLSELNLQLLDTDTKLVLAEKEQALLGIRASDYWLFGFNLDRFYFLPKFY